VITAVKFDDLIPYYPHNWIEGYLGTTVTVNHNEITRASEGKNNNLTNTQKNLLTNADVGDELTLSIKYLSRNSVTGNNDRQEIKLEFTVVSDQDAKPASGIEKMRDYFRVATFKAFEDGSGDAFAGASVQFKVDGNGNISDASLSKSSGNMAADQRLLKSVRSMPVWTPAQDKSGKKYSREFILEVVRAGC
jgi:TonB family protein